MSRYHVSCPLFFVLNLNARRNVSIHAISTRSQKMLRSLTLFLQIILVFSQPDLWPENCMIGAEYTIKDIETMIMKEINGLTLGWDYRSAALVGAYNQVLPSDWVKQSYKFQDIQQSYYRCTGDAYYAIPVNQQKNITILFIGSSTSFIGSGIRQTDIPFCIKVDNAVRNPSNIRFLHHNISDKLVGRLWSLGVTDIAIYAKSLQESNSLCDKFADPCSVAAGFNNITKYCANRSFKIMGGYIIGYNDTESKLCGAVAQKWNGEYVWPAMPPSPGSYPSCGSSWNSNYYTGVIARLSNGTSVDLTVQYSFPYCSNSYQPCISLEPYEYIFAKYEITFS